MTFINQLKQRLAATGDRTPGLSNYTADILEIVAAEAKRWSNRLDDAQRFPDVLRGEVAGSFRVSCSTCRSLVGCEVARCGGGAELGCWRRRES